MSRVAWMCLFFNLFITVVGAQDKDSCEPESVCQKILAEIETGRSELASLSLSKSSGDVRYTEIIRRTDGAERRRTVIDFEWKEIGLKIMNLDRCETRVIKIIKRGPQLVNENNDFVIEIEMRPSGLVWNDWNTAFKVVNPREGGRWAVILNKYPRRLNDGSRQDAIYSPYSSVLHRQDLIAEGQRYLNRSSSSAGMITYSRYNLVRDSIKPESIIEDEFLFLHRLELPEFISRLALIEQADPFEFYEFEKGNWRYNPFERVLILLALNGESAYGLTVSTASASGLMQFTKPTWNTMMKLFPWRNLVGFEYGPRIHREAMSAAILLENYNFRVLKNVFGQSISKDKNLEFYLAAAYNGGIGDVVRAVRNSKNKKTNWRVELRKIKSKTETLDYLDKLDYLVGLGSQKE